MQYPYYYSQLGTRVQRRMDADRRISGGASAESIERARELIGPDETLLAVYTIGDTNKRLLWQLVRRKYLARLCNPLSWPLGLFGAPLVLSMLKRDTLVLANGTMYVITDARLYRQVDFDPGCCLVQGVLCHFSGSVTLNNLTVVETADDKGVQSSSSMPSFVTCSVPAVSSEGNSLADLQLADGAAGFCMFVDDPEMVAKLLHSTVQAASRRSSRRTLTYR